MGSGWGGGGGYRMKKIDRRIDRFTQFFIQVSLSFDDILANNEKFMSPRANCHLN